MVAWFLIAIATLIIFAFIAVNSVQTLSMVSDAGGRIETVKRLDAVASALISRATSPNNDGVIYLPVGENNGTDEGYGLPSYLGFQTQTAFGQKFVYCPFGDTGGTGTTLTIPNADGTSYNVATATFEGRDYVVGGRPSYPALSGQPNLIGYVMAPRSKLSDIPSCGDAVYNSTTRKFEAPDALVRPLTRENGVDESRTIDARRVTFYVSPTGTGVGASEADPTSFATAINFLKSRQPSSMEIKMAAGNYGLSPSDLNMSAYSNDRGTKLTISGVGSSTFIDMSASGYVNIPGDVTMNDVIFDSDTMFIVRGSSSLEMKNVQAGALQSAGRVTIEGGSNAFTTENGFAISVQPGGNMLVSGVVNLANPSRAGFYVREGGDLSFVNATVNFPGDGSSAYIYGVQALDGRVSLTASTFNYPVGASQGIYMAGGDLTLRNATMSFSSNSTTSSVFLDRGATFTMYNSVLGAGAAPPAYGVRDIGARSVAGVNSQIYAGNCWFGGLFNWSEPGVSGNSSEVTAGEPEPALSASPSKAEVEAYVTASDNNTKRTLFRRSNESEWTCM